MAVNFAKTNCNVDIVINGLLLHSNLFRKFAIMGRHALFSFSPILFMLYRSSVKIFRYYLLKRPNMLLYLVDKY